MSNFDLTIEGAKIRFRMSIAAFRIYTEMHNIELSELGDHLQKKSLFGMADMLYAAHDAHCKKEGKENIYSREEATEWVGDLDEKAIEQINNAILDVRMMGKSLREQGEETKKKTAKK